MAGGIPGYIIQKQGYPGGGAFRTALDYYTNQMFGPSGLGAGQLAGAQATDQAAGQYYATPTIGDPGSGARQASAQGAFGNLLSGEAAANNAAAATDALTKAQAGQGILATTQGYANDIAQQLSSNLALNTAKGNQGLQNSGLFGGLLNSFIDPKGAGSNVVNAFTGGNTSGLAQGIGGLSSLFGGGGGGISDLLGSTLGGADISGLGLGAGDLLGAGAGATTAAGGVGSFLDFLPFLAGA